MAMIIAKSLIAIILSDIQLKSSNANMCQNQFFAICHQFEEKQNIVINLALSIRTK